MTTEAIQTSTATPAATAAAPTQAGQEGSTPQVTQQVTQPAAKPAAPAKEAAAFGATQSYEKTGNVNLDTALAWAGSLGLDGDTSPEMQEAFKGNFGPLRALLATKDIPGAEAYLALAESGFKEFTAAAGERQAAVQGMVVQVAGSGEAWAEVMAWAGENAEQEEKDAVNYALAKGGFLAEAVAQALVSNYRQQAGVSSPPRQTAARDTAAATPAAGTHGPLSPKEYTKAVSELRKSLKGKSLEGSQEYTALQKRRAAWRG
ncbi:hypothetical protein LMG3458_02491 [Achromobacter deleyi]|uniref:Scaffolding-like protein n=1 Tax=Achromobacter deleyi TaxID=1353891 RepID=A0A6S7B4R6_9BURK|nr:hypothetical protein [Achromobacter deleyi]CAB3697951.1 hypothetical protein LMG3458_02491 [Achromobacter deleyi]